MRILLATAVALAPLMAASGAAAEVVISAVRTTPIQTVNATGTGPDSIRIASSGDIQVASGGAVTINSSHGVRIDSGGRITMSNTASGSTGILAQGGNSGNIAVAGAIGLSDSITAYEDTDKDGDDDGPFAAGTDKVGIRLAGPGALTGNILVESTGEIAIEGNNSAGIRLEGDLVGSVTNFGTIRILGDNSVGVQTLGDVNGSLNIGGTMNVQGGGSSGVVVEGDVSGRVAVQAVINNTGYRVINRPADTVIAKFDADDLLQGGSAVAIRGNVGAGVIIDTRPTETNANSTDDDNDGLLDGSETVADIKSYGSAPAVALGSTTQAITIGVAGTGENAYGVINRGSIGAQGVYDNIDATGVRIGIDGGQAVTVAGGFSNSGVINGGAFQANAYGVRVGTGASVPTILNSGSIGGGVLTNDPARNAAAIQIDAGATVTTLDNSGALIAGTTGTAATVTAVRDLSGTLTTINNSRAIDAVFELPATGGTFTGRTIAIDVAANTTGVTLTQTGTVTPPNAGDLDSDGDGVVDINEPRIAGDVLFGSGADVFDIRNGTVTGAISFGNGADRLSITGGSVVAGAITDSDGQLDINVANGVLDARQTAATNASSLTIGGDGALIVTLDPATNTASGFNVSGNATLANGAELGVRFTSLITTPQRLTVINANSLNYGAVDTSATQENSPFLFVVTPTADIAAGDVFIDVRRRTAAEADLIAVETAAFDPFYTALQDPDAVNIRNAFLAQNTREDFINLYEQLLPDHSGGPLLSLASGVDAVTRALVGRNASAAPGETSAWVQEINFYAEKDQTDTYGFNSEGFGVAGGIERGTGLGAVGLSLAFTSSDLEDPEAEAEEVLSASLIELGLYWRAQGQNWTTWARAAAGYAYFDSERRLVGGGLNLSNESDWNGFSLTAAGGVSYEKAFGRFFIRPEAYLEYFSLSESAHDESGGGDGFDLSIDDRDGHLFSGVAAVNIGMNMGDNDWLKPELRLGWRQNISVDPGETRARFRSGGPDFILNGETIEGGGPIAGLRINVGNELGMLTASADAEMIEDYIRLMIFLRASFRF